MSKLFDISLGITPHTIVYPGNPPVAIHSQQAIARGDGANVSALAFGSHTATHIDAPQHFFDDGAGVDSLPLDVLIGPAILVDVGPDVRAITASVLRECPLGAHTRVLVRTRNSALLRQPTFDPEYSYLAPDGAEYLVDRGVQLVGCDYLSIEEFHSGHHRTHRTLLGRGVVIVEGLDLSEPPPGEYELICLPLLLMGLDGAPARAVLRQLEAR